MANREARYLYQPDDGHLSFAVLVAVCRFHLARRRRPQFSRRGFLAAAVDYLSRRGYLSGIVMAGPLFPLNSLMLHGLIYAQHANHLDTDPDGDFAAEVHDYFGTGTQLQEMYITHSLLTEKDWDILAEAAKWSRENLDTLVDTHWVGGDPALLEVYGWASWSARKGILVLRNPSDQAQDFVVDVNSAFELPPGAPETYEARSPWREDRET